MISTIPTPGLRLDYLPCTGGARLVRVFGDSPCPVLPDTVDGLPITELGDYCFAPQQRTSALPPENALCRYTVPGGIPCENRIGGSFLSSITLPESLGCIGSCAFYNCRGLTAIQMGRQVHTIGSDVFLNTFALTRITVRAQPDQSCGMFEILNSIPTDVQVFFQPENTILAVATYPEYWMDVEESPAHIFLQTYDGQGFRYRQCFSSGAPEWQAYDAILAQSHSSNPARIMTRLALDRLRWPFALSDAARRDYQQYLRGNLSSCIAMLLAAGDTAGLADLLAMKLLDKAALTDAAAQARKQDNAEFAALLADALAKLTPARPAKKADRYSFDF